MAYVGRGIDKVSNIEVLDVITFTDSAGPYNLLKDTVAFTPTSPNALVISVDGVVQSPDSYTIASATITFDSVMAASSTMDFIYQIGTGVITSPSDGSVTAAKIATDAVETAKIKDLNVTVGKLPASVDLSTKTITLPASVSGLGTGIDVTSQITGVVPTANLGSGSASSTTILYGDQTYKAEPTEYNDDALQNDIATLALHQATNANAAKYNLANTNVDVYQDSTGIASLTNCARDTTGEYISTSEPASYGTLTNFVANNWDIGALTPFTVGDGTAVHAASPDQSALIVTNASATTPLTFEANKPFQVTATNAAATHGAFLAFYKPSEEPSGSPVDNSDWTVGGLGKTTDGFTMQMGTVYGQVSWGNGTTQTNFVSGDSDFDFNGTQYTIARDELGVFRIYQGTRSGTLILTSTSTGGQDFSSTVEYAFAWGGSGSFASSHTSFQYSQGSAESLNATGNYVSTATTANASVSKVGIVITYKNQSGTNTLNTDIVAQVSADGGSNYSTVTLAAAGTFSTGVLQAVANDVSVTAGTSIQYKISFANQSEGVKEARITGVSLIY